MHDQLGTTREALEETTARCDRGRGQVRRRGRWCCASHHQQRTSGHPTGTRGHDLAWRASAVLAWALMACAHPPSEPSSPSVVQHEATFQNGFLHVAVSIPQSSRARKPVVIGALEDRERLLALGIAVAHYENDWDALERAAREVRDPPEPNQVGAWMLAAPRPGIVGRSYLGLVGASARLSVPRLVDWLSSLPEIDATRIAIAGSSTHGFIALEALMIEPRLAVGVVRAACGDYHTFLRSSSLALRDDERWLPDGALVLDADYEAELRDREPIRFAERFPPRPLLLLGGGDDAAIPLACVEATARALDAAYARVDLPERFRLVIYEGLGHDLQDAAADEVLGWWRRWLLAADPPASAPPRP